VCRGLYARRHATGGKMWTRRAQSPAPPTRQVAFEVASVKPNNSDSGSSSSNDRAGGYTATNMALRRLISIAYRINLANRDHIIGPEWIDTARFDITARAPENSPADQIPDMLRALLADRFKLVTHVEIREAPVYALVSSRADSKLGPQLTPSALDCSKPGTGLSSSFGAGVPGIAAPASMPQCGTISNVDANGAVMRGGGRSMTQMANQLNGRVDRTVIDRTGLTGTYDFVLRWTPENLRDAAVNAGPSRDGTSIFTALQEQLGLKLEAQRGPVEFLIIDRVEPPAPN
jgi:uncharacterized protein (TIGR03435 family)